MKREKLRREFGTYGDLVDKLPVGLSTGSARARLRAAVAVLTSAERIAPADRSALVGQVAKSLAAAPGKTYVRPAGRSHVPQGEFITKAASLNSGTGNGWWYELEGRRLALLDQADAADRRAVRGEEQWTALPAAYIGDRDAILKLATAARSEAEVLRRQAADIWSEQERRSR